MTVLSPGPRIFYQIECHDTSGFDSVVDIVAIIADDIKLAGGHLREACKISVVSPFVDSIRHVDYNKHNWSEILPFT